MLCCRVASGVRVLADRYKNIFQGSAGSYSNLCAFMTYFLFGFCSMSETVRACPWSHSVSDLSRAVKIFDANRFMRRMRNSILRHYQGEISAENFCFAVDDTSNPKYGKYRTGSWHCSKGLYFGQKILLIALVDFNRGIAIPISYCIVAKEADPDYKPARKLAIDLLRQSQEEGFPQLPVATDSWFDSVEFMQELQDIGLSFAGEIKANRNVKPCPSPYVKWRSLPDIFQKLPRARLSSRFDSEAVRTGKKRAKAFSARRINIRERKSPLQVIAVYNRLNGKKAFAYYATTDLTMAGTKLWEISRGRWKIECLFRDLKQCLSFGKLPCQDHRASDLAICIPCILLTSLRLDGKDTWGTEPASIAKMTTQIRETALQKSINIILEKGNLPIKNALKERRHIKRINRKPVHQAAEAA